MALSCAPAAKLTGRQTFAAAGLDISAFKDTGAAYVHSVASQEVEKIQPSRAGKGKEEPSGPFVWPSCVHRRNVQLLRR